MKLHRQLSFVAASHRFPFCKLLSDDNAQVDGIKVRLSSFYEASSPLLVLEAHMSAGLRAVQRSIDLSGPMLKIAIRP